jgi:hypothetical protein
MEREALTSAYSREQVVQIRASAIRRRHRGFAVQPIRSEMGPRQCDFLLHGSAAPAIGVTNPCDGSLLYLGGGQPKSAVALPDDTCGLQRHHHVSVDTAGTRTVKPMSTITLTVEQAQAKLDLLKQDDIEGALGEIQRELQVRERCYPRWVEEGKMSRIDAKDRMNRQIQAQELLSLLLTVAPE